MNTLTQHHSTRPSHFKLKPLLIAIPLTVLAACANTYETGQSNDTDAIEIVKDTTYEEPAISGPDLTGGELAEADLTRAALDTNGTLNKLNTNNTLDKNDNMEGDTPMTVLVIENPELLAKLSNSRLVENQITTNQQAHSEVLPQEEEVESMLRPGKRVFHFGFNQTSLSEEDIAFVEKHAEYLNANPALKVTIHGHTDTQGNSDYNLKLSETRALMLVSQLKKFGITKNRIQVIGWGGNYPLVNSLNFSENRRIEIEYSETHYAANH